MASLGKPKEAYAELELSSELHKRLVEQAPNVLDYQIGLSGDYCNFGQLVAHNGRPGDSLEWFDRGIRILQPIHEKVPGHMTAKRFLRNSYWGRARAHDQLRKNAEALRDWDLAIELSSQRERPGFRAGRANTRLHSGMIAEAVADVGELTKVQNWTAAQWYDFACVYSVASGTVGAKKQEYADQAMDLLRKAVAAGYKDVALLKSDAAFDALRDREDFKKLISDLR
jgi:tetratricopeptide (TPR) repeat protein